MANKKNEAKHSDQATTTPIVKVAPNFHQCEVSEKELEKVVGGITSHSTGGGAQGVPSQ